MNEQVFWTMIELAKEKSGDNLMVQIELIIEAVSELDISDIFLFDYEYRQLLDKSNEADLWGAAYVLCNGCDVKEFEYFKNWLILTGQYYFKKAVEDPEVLVAFIPVFQRNAKEILHIASDFSTLAAQAYATNTDEYDYHHRYPFPIQNTTVRGELWKDHLELADRLPLLCYNMGWGNPLYKGNWVSDK